MSVVAGFRMRHSASLVLIAAQIAIGVPTIAQTRAPAPGMARPVLGGPLPAPKVTVNRTVPAVTMPAEAPTFSSSPTNEEIFRAHVFSEPLVPVGPPTTPADNRALADALVRFHRDGGTAWNTTLGQFLDRYPSSPWRAGLLLHIGTLESQAHAYSNALAAWEESWSLSKGATDPNGRAVADSALAELIHLQASFGKVKEVEARLASIVGRRMSGAAGIKIARAREAIVVIKTRPDLAILCGPEAILALLEARDGKLANTPAAISRYRGSLEGASLAEMKTLAAAAGLDLHIVARVNGDELPVPSIVHWKIGHYGTVVEKKDDLYRVVDRARRETYWIDAATLLEESSGYFLSLNPSAQGWRAAADEEATSIKGSGPICPDGASPPAPPRPPPSGCNGGMCGYSFDAVTASLLLYDTPLKYRPPLGPDVPFTVAYSQRESTQPQIFNYANLGPKWTLGWVRFVKEEPTDALGVTPPHTWVSLPPGGREVFVNPDLSGVFPAHWSSRAVLIRTGTSPIRYERHLPDGTVEVFALSDGAASGARRVFLTEIIDPQGQTLTLTWDSQLRLVAVTDAIGQVSTLQYAGADPLKLTGITDPFGRQALLTYNASGQLETITDVLGLVSHMSYSDYDFVSTLRTPYGQTTFRHEDTPLASSYGVRFIEATDALGATERMEFRWEMPAMDDTVPSGQVPSGFTAWNERLNLRNSFYWNKHAWAASPGNISNAVMTHWMEKAEWTGWQVYSQPIPHSIKRPLEGRVWYSYPDQPTEWMAGSYSQPERIARVLDDGTTQTYSFSYNAVGNVLTATDPLGRRVTYTYESNDQDIATIRQTTGSTNDLLATYGSYALHLPGTHTDASGNTTSYLYNSDGQVTSITNPLAETKTFTYTGGYVTNVSAPGSIASLALSYDGYGRARTMTRGDGYALTIDYDVFDRIVRLSYPDSTFEERSYDRLDISTVRDRRGRITRLYHNALRQLVGTRDPAGNTVGQEWCSCGDLAAMVDQKGNKTRWERDVQGRVIREVRPDASTVELSYAPVSGRRVQRTDPKGQETNYEYFLDGALKQKSYANATTSTATTSFTYDAIYGRLATATDGIGTTTYSYGAVGSSGAGSVSAVDGPWASDTVSYAYDDLGRLTDRTMGSNATSFSFDALGRMTGIDDPLGDFELEYDGESGNLSRLEYPNGQTTTYTYFANSADRRLDAIHHKTAAGATLSRFGHEYDGVGNITSWTQQYGTTTREYALAYDAADRLTRAIYQTTDSTPTVLKKYIYRYDAVGNRVGAQENDAPQAWTYNNMNRVVAQGGSALLEFAGSLNEAGTVTVAGKPTRSVTATVFEGDTAVTDGTNTIELRATDASGNTSVQSYEVDVTDVSSAFTHDANGNITAHGTRTYEWDAENRLVSVRISGTDVAAFAYDWAGRRVEKSAGGTTRHYVYDGDHVLEERIGGNATRFVYGPFTDQILASTDGTDASFYLTDHLGSVVQITDESETVQTTRRYDPFGQMIEGDTISGYAYTGREWDAETGLYYYRARYYDPSLGRFIGADPAGFVDGPNLYAYVRSNPARYVDPFGLKVGDWWDVVANLQRAKAIADAEMAKRPDAHNNAEDAMRHAEWMRRTTEETNTFIAWLAGTVHELDGLLKDQPLEEALMDMHNNAAGRRAGRERKPVDPNLLQTLDGPDKPYETSKTERDAYNLHASCKR